MATHRSRSSSTSRRRRRGKRSATGTIHTRSGSPRKNHVSLAIVQEKEATEGRGGRRGRRRGEVYGIQYHGKLTGDVL